MQCSQKKKMYWRKIWWSKECSTIQLMEPQGISENGSPSTFWTTSRDSLFEIKSKEEDPLRFKTSVIFPSTLFICSRATNPGVFFRPWKCLPNPTPNLLGATDFLAPPYASTSLYFFHFPSHFITPLCSLFFFSSFHFSLVFRKADRVPEKKSWLTESKGTCIMFSEAQST